MTRELKCDRCKKPIERGYYGDGAVVVNDSFTPGQDKLREVCRDCARALLRKRMRHYGEWRNLRIISLIDNEMSGTRFAGYRLYAASIDLRITLNEKHMRQLKNGDTRIWFKFNGEIWTGLVRRNTAWCNVWRTNRKFLPDVGKKD